MGHGQFLTASQTNTIMSNFNWEINVMLFAGFSIALGLINLLPFPALDGSLPLLWLIETINKNRRIVTVWLVKIGFIILMVFQIIVLIYWLR